MTRERRKKKYAMLYLIGVTTNFDQKDALSLRLRYGIGDIVFFLNRNNTFYYIL